MRRSALRLHDDARAELLEAHRYYWARSPAIADAFLLELERAFDEIAEAPTRWPVWTSGTRRVVLRRFPFSIAYVQRAEMITVVALVHAKRRPGYWRSRRPE